jgi:hypothetical protein
MAVTPLDGELRLAEMTLSAASVRNAARPNPLSLPVCQARVGGGRQPLASAVSHQRSAISHGLGASPTLLPARHK